MQVTPRPLKERQRQEREQLILQVAEQVLLEKGYHETSMDEVAARVGVSKGTVYLHFPSKEDLVKAILVRSMDMFLQEMEKIIASDSTNRAKLEAMLHFMYTDLFSQQAQLLANPYNSGEFYHVFTVKEGPLYERRMRLVELVTSIVEAGKATGEITPAIPTYVLVGTLFSLVSPHRFIRLTVDRALDPEELTRYMSHIFFSGVANNAQEQQ